MGIVGIINKKDFFNELTRQLNNRTALKKRDAISVKVF